MQQTFSLHYLTSQLETKVFAQKMRDKLAQFVEILSKDKIDIKQLQNLAFTGIPEDLKGFHTFSSYKIGLRPLCWKLLLGYLPPDKSSWNSTIKKQEQVYNQFCSDFFKQKLTNDQIQQLQEIDRNSNLSTEQENQLQKKIIISQPVKDHPLSKKKSSNWATFFEDQALWDEIERDSIKRRTRSELSFFQQPTQIQNKYPIFFRTNVQKERRKQNDAAHKHYDVITRILFIYAKLNPGIKYVQGMNEILAPIYYTYYNDTSDFFLQSVEFDAFFSFTIFMADAKDNFIRSLDNSQDGIKAKINLFSQYLKIYDEEIWEHFEKLGINPQFYSLRWIMLFLTQEFELFDVLRLWDSLLSKEDKNQFVLFLCLGIIGTIRSKLLHHDFTDVLQHLQRLYGEDVLEILSVANEIQKK